MNEVHVLHVRTFPADLEMSEGQLFGRLVPYNVATKVLDRLPNGRIEIYDEGFRPGVFARQAASTEPGVVRRIELVHTHQGGLGFLGPATGLEERSDGTYGFFQVLRSKRSDVEDLMAAGIGDLSVEFRERPGSDQVEDGVTWRTDARLDRVALEAMGAYQGAEVLSFRDLDEMIEEHAADEERKRAEAEATAAAEAEAERERVEREAAEAATEARRRELAELDEFLEEAKATQADYAARLG
jgi:hypothetical protein